MITPQNVMQAAWDSYIAAPDTYDFDQVIQKFVEVVNRERKGHWATVAHLVVMWTDYLRKPYEIIQDMLDGNFDAVYLQVVQGKLDILPPTPVFDINAQPWDLLGNGEPIEHINDAITGLNLVWDAFFTDSCMTPRDLSLMTTSLISGGVEWMNQGATKEELIELASHQRIFRPLRRCISDEGVIPWEKIKPVLDIDVVSARVSFLDDLTGHVLRPVSVGGILRAVSTDGLEGHIIKSTPTGLEWEIEDEEERNNIQKQLRLEPEEEASEIEVKLLSAQRLWRAGELDELRNLLADILKVLNVYETTASPA